MKPTKEQLANRKDWLAALESGNYVQGQVVLRTKHKVTFCCLGVAADRAGVKKIGKPKSKHILYAFSYTDPGERITTKVSASYPPAAWFAQRFGVTERQASFIQDIAIALNDAYENVEGKIVGVKTFKQIAKEMRKSFREADAENKVII